MIFDVLVTGPEGVLLTILGYKERKNDMGEMSQEKKEYYLKEADNHANFLADKVFKPAFVMAFIHGVKHGMEDAMKELKARQELQCKKEILKDELNNSARMKRKP